MISRGTFFVFELERGTFFNKEFVTTKNRFSGSCVVGCTQTAHNFRMSNQDSNSQRRSWCFTMNNYTDEDVTRLEGLHGTNDVVFIVFGKETGDNGTPHLQGFIQFEGRKRFGQVKTILGSNPHLEGSRNVAASITYCKKDGVFFERGECRVKAGGKRDEMEAFKDEVKSGVFDLKVLRENHSTVMARYGLWASKYIQDKRPPVQLESYPLRRWQAKLNAELNLRPDARKIFFLVDRVGNTGKTWFAHYYCSLHQGCQVLLPGRKTDMAHALEEGIRVLFMDAPRSKQGEYLQYDFLEDVKNGYVFATKYESRVKRLPRVHVVVNMNEMPDMTKLSADRYAIVELSTEDLVVDA